MNKEKIKNFIVNIFYPRRCAICDKALAGDLTICSDCSGKVRTISGDTCHKCGKKLKHDEEMFCYDCRRLSKCYDRGFAVFEYDDIKGSIYRFKYSRRPEYALFYADKTNELLGDVIKQLGIQAYIPVPIHDNRLRMRGYNQSIEFARALSDITGVPVLNGFVIRSKNTSPLKKMDAFKRKEALKNAFKLVRNDVKLTRVCVIDDIYTTGATINAISALLKGYGIREVYFITIAIGRGL